MRSSDRWQVGVYEQIDGLLQPMELVRGLWLGGSLARGEDDRFSDVDLIAAIDGATPTDAGTALCEVVGDAFDVVLCKNWGSEQQRVLNFVTDDWTRIDIGVLSTITIQDSPLRFGLQTLFDKDDLKLPVDRADHATDENTASELEAAVTEFIRVLGLLPVVLGRNDLIGAVSGAGVFRGQLIALLAYEQRRRTRRGALNQTSLLSTAAAEAVRGLPPLVADRTSVIEFHRTCWTVFNTFGPRIHEQYGVAWPGRLVEAVRSRLWQELGVQLARAPTGHGHDR